MKILLLVLALCLNGAFLRAEDMQIGGSVTGTAQIAGLTVPLDRILVTPKPKYVYILWDSFAERDAIQSAGKSFSLEAAALALAKGLGLAVRPKSTLFMVDVAEFPERDDYDAPRWDKLKFLGRYVVELRGGKWIVKKRSGE